MSTRWERLLDQKPVPLLEHLLEEVGRLLQQELQAWPLSVQELDTATGARFADFLTGEAKRPAKEVFSEAMRLARWDLERATDRVDDYFRNRLYQASGLTDADRPALLFVSRWLLEQLLSVAEATSGRVKRADLLRVLDRLASSPSSGAASPGRAPQ
jgi:hypothetical protein